VQPLDYLVHFSNILLLVAYSVRDILWLRWFAVAAALTNIPYFLLQGTVLWPPILWALVFTAINLYQIARLYLERRPVVLSEDEQKLYDLGFRSLRAREFLSLSLAGEWKSAAAGERVVTEGEPVSCLCIAITGNAVRAMQLEAEIRANPELRADRFVESWQQLQDQRGRLTGSSNREARQQVESQMSDPQRWQALRDAASVWASNAKALEDCQRRAVKAGKGVSCSISVGDPQR